jgi:hypothetical protein
LKLRICRPWPDYYPCVSGRTMTSQDLPAANQSTRALIKLWRRISLPRLPDGQCQQRRGCSFERNGEKRSPWPDYYSCASGRTLTSQDLPAANQSTRALIRLSRRISLPKSSRPESDDLTIQRSADRRNNGKMNGLIVFRCKPTFG